MVASKRWPCVVLPDVKPSTLRFTICSPCKATKPCAGRTKLTLSQPSANWYVITLGIGNLANDSLSAICKPSLKLAPLTVMSKNNASALPSISRLSCGTAEASKLKPPKRFNKAGVALPSASKPTVTGISFCDICLSAATAATFVICAAKRRGDAKAVVTEFASLKPWLFKVSANTPENASPSFLSTLGGSSSTNNSTNKFCADIDVPDSYLFLITLTTSSFSRMTSVSF